ncbi:MAG: ATP-grasp domain-containing protein, partial [Planctomycetota bacterium]|nr:ATP-grasp domain-containing protein [Planctomycetota bacterium]
EYDVRLIGVHNSIRRLQVELRRHPPDIVFNSIESYNNVRDQEANVAGVFELLGVPYTGCRASVLHLCRNKMLTKRILSPHRIRVPNFVYLPMGSRKRSLRGLKFPVIVKPLGFEGSEGVVNKSFAETSESALERVDFLHNNLKSDALVEEFIEGREFYSGVLGNDRLTVLPLREMFFKKFPDDRAKFATFKAKWDPEFRSKWGITNCYADALPDGVEEKIARISRTAYRALGLTGYGRLDLRLTPENEIYVLEVNPNPSLQDDDEIAYAAYELDIEYTDLIEKIVNYGLQIGSRFTQ